MGWGERFPLTLCPSPPATDEEVDPHPAPCLGSTTELTLLVEALRMWKRDSWPHPLICHVVVRVRERCPLCLHLPQLPLGKWALHLAWAAQQSWPYWQGCRWTDENESMGDLAPPFICLYDGVGGGEISLPPCPHKWLGNTVELSWWSRCGNVDPEVVNTGDLAPPWAYPGGESCGELKGWPTLSLSSLRTWNMSWPTPTSTPSMIYENTWRGRSWRPKAAGSPWHRATTG